MENIKKRYKKAPAAQAFTDTLVLATQSEILHVKAESQIKPMFPLYRNQLVDLLCKLTDWFIYNGNIGVQTERLDTIITLDKYIAQKQLPRDVLKKRCSETWTRNLDPGPGSWNPTLDPDPEKPGP